MFTKAEGGTFCDECARVREYVIAITVDLAGDNRGTTIYICRECLDRMARTAQA